MRDRHRHAELADVVARAGDIQIASRKVATQDIAEGSVKSGEIQYGWLSYWGGSHLRWEPSGRDGELSRVVDEGRGTCLDRIGDIGTLTVDGDFELQRTCIDVDNHVLFFHANGVGELGPEEGPLVGREIFDACLK